MDIILDIPLQIVRYIFSFVPFKLLNEVLFYCSRAVTFFVIFLSILGSLAVILKFSLGLGLKQIKIFTNKGIAKALSSALLENSTAEQKLSKSKTGLIRRTMLVLCVADILLSLDNAAFIGAEIPYLKTSWFKNQKLLETQIFKHFLRTLGHTRQFFYFYTASWSVCYLIALFQSLNKMVWKSNSCTFVKYDLFFHTFCFFSSLCFFLMWFLFRNGWLVLTTWIIEPTKYVRWVEYEITSAIYGLTFIGDITFYVVNVASVFLIVNSVKKNIEKGASLGVKSLKVMKQEGKLFFFFTKFLLANFLFFFAHGAFQLYMSIAYFFLPLFDVTDTFFYDYFEIFYNTFFPAHGLFLFIAMLINVDQITFVGTCCNCCECLPDFCLRKFCCGRRSKYAKQREQDENLLNEYKESVKVIESLNQDNVLEKMDTQIEYGDMEEEDPTIHDAVTTNTNQPAVVAGAEAAGQISADLIAENPKLGEFEDELNYIENGV